MIRRLLNNRWFVVVLAVASGLLLVRSVAAPFLGTPDFSDVEDPEFYLDEPVEDSRPELSELAALASGQSVLSGQLNWKARPLRDPFSRKAPVQGVTAYNTSAVATVGSTRLPRLDALVAGPDSLFAILDDRIVREGDSIPGYRVTRIDPTGVLLATPSTSHRLSVADMRVTSIVDTSADNELDLNASDETFFPAGDSGF